MDPDDLTELLREAEPNRPAIDRRRLTSALVEGPPRRSVQKTALWLTASAAAAVLGAVVLTRSGPDAPAPSRLTGVESSDASPSLDASAITEQLAMATELLDSATALLTEIEDYRRVELATLRTHLRASETLYLLLTETGTPPAEIAKRLAADYPDTPAAERAAQLAVN